MSAMSNKIQVAASQLKKLPYEFSAEARHFKHRKHHVINLHLERNYKEFTCYTAGKTDAPDQQQ